MDTERTEGEGTGEDSALKALARGARQPVSFGETVIYIILAAAAGATAIFWFSVGPDYMSGSAVPRAWSALAVQCRQADGTWLAEHRECEQVEQAWCDDRGGSFFGCESSCRHLKAEDGPADFCIAQCVPVCRLKVSVSYLGPGPLNAAYLIEGNDAILERGQAEAAGLGRIRILEALAVGDLNGDDYEDAAVILTLETPDGNIRYYAAAALQTENGLFRGTNAVWIGDRIGFQSSVIGGDGTVTVSYADRYPWEDPAGRPSVGKSVRLQLSGNFFREISGPELSARQAEQLAVGAWGDCRRRDCDRMEVRTLDGRGGVWYVQADYAGIKDDSIAAVRRTAPAIQVEGRWRLGAELPEMRTCHPGRGQQEFSSAFCL